MANTTFNGPVRSENGFKTIIKNSTTGALTNEMTLSTYSTSITIAASGTSFKGCYWNACSFHSNGRSCYRNNCGGEQCDIGRYWHRRR